MPAREFKPKLGTPRDGARSTHRITRRVVKAATRQRAAKSPWANALTRRPVAELGRGKVARCVLFPPPPGSRRVIVKVRIARHGTSDLAAARSHQHYLMRDGVTRDGGRGELYDREHNIADGNAFLEQQKGDTYQFRFIIAPEDSSRMADLKPFLRDLMADMEDDLHTKLDWVAVDHFNTGHPHTHVIIAGHDDRGDDLVMAREYISHGIRHRAQELVTRELGIEMAWERTLKLASEMRAERFTSLDRGILKDSEDNVLVASARTDGDRGREALQIGRLRHLERMGLAEERRTGVWTLDAGVESKLRQMGERGDIMVTMNRVMREHGLDRPAGEFAIFAGAPKSKPVLGRVVGTGIADEMTDRRYLVVDGLDGRLHYAETSTLGVHNDPEAGMIVALSGGNGRGKLRNTQVEIVSHWPIERLPNADAATWLDKVILAETRPVIREKGFGVEVSKALTARETWLIAQGLARSETPGAITPKPDMLRDLEQRGRAALAKRLEAELKLPYAPMIAGVRFTGQHVRTVDMPSMHVAIVKNREEFTLVPWRPELMQMRGHAIDMSIHDRGLSITFARAQERTLGLSR